MLQYLFVHTVAYLWRFCAPRGIGLLRRGYSRGQCVAHLARLSLSLLTRLASRGRGRRLLHLSHMPLAIDLQNRSIRHQTLN